MIRKTTATKHIPIKDRVELIKNFHQFTHDIRTDTKYVHQSEEYGRFKPANILHYDEIPCPFAFGSHETCEFEGNKRVHAKKPGNAFAKREYTVTLCFNGGNIQYVKPQILFRGKETGIKQQEKNQYQQDLLQIFQEKAWQDVDAMIQLLKLYNKCKKECGVKDKTWLIGDNLKCHISARTKKYAAQYAIRYYHGHHLIVLIVYLLLINWLRYGKNYWSNSMNNGQMTI